MLFRRILKTLAATIALVWIVLLSVFLFGATTTSLAVVAPNGLWLLALGLIGPFVIAFVLWRLAGLIKTSE